VAEEEYEISEIFSVVDWEKTFDKTSSFVLGKLQKVSVVASRVLVNFYHIAKKFIDGDDWLLVKTVNIKYEEKLYSQFLVFLEETAQAGDLQRYKAVLKLQNGGEKWLSKEPTSFVAFAPNVDSLKHKFIALEPLTLIDYRAWKAYDLAKDLKMESHMTIHYWSKDGKGLIVSQTNCPFDCPKDLITTYWKINLK